MIGPSGVPSGISFTEIEAYARLLGFDDLDDRVTLVHFVKVCDYSWMTETAKRRGTGGGTEQHAKGGGRLPRNGNRRP